MADPLQGEAIEVLSYEPTTTGFPKYALPMAAGCRGTSAIPRRHLACPSRWQILPRRPSLIPKRLHSLPALIRLVAAVAQGEPRRLACSADHHRLADVQHAPTSRTTTNPIHSLTMLLSATGPDSFAMRWIAPTTGETVRHEDLKSSGVFRTLTIPSVIIDLAFQ